MNNKKRYQFKLGYMLIYLIPVYLFLFTLLILAILRFEFVISIAILIVIYLGLTLYLRWVYYFDNYNMVTFYMLEGFKRIKYNKINMVYINTKKLGAGQYTFFVKYSIKGKEKKAKFEFGGNRDYLLEIINFINLKVNNDVIDEKSFKEIDIRFNDNEYIDLRKTK